MKKLAVLAIVSAGITVSHAVPTFAQAPGRIFARPGQSSNVYRPNPTFAPPVLPPRNRVMVDSRGNHVLAVEQFVSVWDPRRGRWILQSNQELRTPATNQSRPAVDSSVTTAHWTNRTELTTHKQHAMPQGPNQVAQPAGQGTKPTRPTIHPELTSGLGTNSIGQPTSSNSAQPMPPSSPAGAQGTSAVGQPANSNGAQPMNPGSPAVALGTSAIGQPTIASNPPLVPAPNGPQPLYAANLGIYYQPVRYDDGTFGAKLTSAPVPGKPAATLPIDTDDVIFLLNDQRFTKSDDLLNHFGQTTVGYIDSSTNTTQSGTIAILRR